jgi:tRNA pseudouridine55 synthase
MGSLHGVLVVDKPPGMTSAAVVARVKRRLGVKKVGHTGTLDPMATGVLPLCLGEGTKVAGYLLAEDKAYQGELLLGVETDTLDAEGEVVRRREAEAAAVDEAALRAAVTAMEGPGEQIPPMFSALKRGGRRLHELARAGEVIELEPRPIVIERFTLTEVALPRARFEVACGKGTYVRSLVRDVGEALGCGAHLTALRRTRSGRFGLDEAVPLDDLDPEIAAARLVSPAQALAHIPGASVPAELVPEVANGKRIPSSELGLKDGQGDEIMRLLTPSGALLALARVDQGRLRYARVFTQALT